MEILEQTVLMEKLKMYIEATRIKNIYIEIFLGLPKNSLSNFLSLKKSLPDKWKVPIEKFCEQQGAVSSFGKEWTAEISSYCLQEGITPLDLINTYKTWKQVRNNVPVVPKVIPDFNQYAQKPETVNDTTEKTSYTKSYNPNDNPIYKKKMNL